jgi:glycosyltransferase involved in cell wall biosynthesis
MRILHIVINPFTHDSRVLKSARAAKSVAGAVRVFALHEHGLDENEENEGIEVRRFRLKTRPWPRYLLIQILKYCELLFRMRREGIRWRPDIVHAHDLNALPIGCAIATRTGARLIYDSHELWIGQQARNTYIQPIRMLMDAVELYFSRKADEIVTVSPGIARILEKRLGITTVHVVRNVPDRWKKTGPDQLKLRHALDIPRDKRVILYQGNLAADGRVECLLEAYLNLKSRDAVLVFMGSGAMSALLRTESRQPKYRNGLYHLEAVAPADMPYYSSDADIGVVPVPDACLSYRLSLPNKLFESIQGGLSIVASDLPEIRRVIEEYKLGLIYKAGDATELSNALDDLLQNRVLLNRCRDNADKAAKILNWENEQRILLKIYQSLAS